MDDREVLFQEYNNLWNEKLVHKQSIRKFHNYLTYITAIGSLVMTVHGVSAADIITGIDPDLLENAIYLFFIAFTPIVLITLTFPLNDIYHIYVMAHQLGELEKKINSLSGSHNLLTWEHVTCPVVYGGEKVRVGQVETRLTNTILLGDILLLAPFIALLCIVSTIFSSVYISKIGCLFSIGYILLVVYMVAVVIMLASKVRRYTKADGPVAGLVSTKRELTGTAEHKEH